MQIVTERPQVPTAIRGAMLKSLKGIGPEFAGGHMDGGIVPKFFQSTAGCLLCRIGADALAERIRRSRTRRLQSRKPTATNNHDSARMAVDKASASFDSDLVVSSARKT